MKLIPLAQVSNILRAGAMLPWGVRDGKGTLLLSRGYMLVDDRAVEVLLERGVYVDASEVTSAGSIVEVVKD